MALYLKRRKGYPWYLQIHDYFADMIDFGKIKEGERLPTYKTISEECSVCISVVQMAYHMLEKDGYIKMTSTGSMVLPRTDSASTSLAKRLNDVILKAQEYGMNIYDIGEATDEVWERWH